MPRGRACTYALLSRRKAVRKPIKMSRGSGWGSEQRTQWRPEFAATSHRPPKALHDTGGRPEQLMSGSKQRSMSCSEPSYARAL